MTMIVVQIERGIESCINTIDDFCNFTLRSIAGFMKREEGGKFHIRWIELSKIPGKKSNRIKMESKETKKKKD